MVHSHANRPREELQMTTTMTNDHDEERKTMVESDTGFVSGCLDVFHGKKKQTTTMKRTRKESNLETINNPLDASDTEEESGDDETGDENAESNLETINNPLDASDTEEESGDDETGDENAAVFLGAKRSRSGRSADRDCGGAPSRPPWLAGACCAAGATPSCPWSQMVKLVLDRMSSPVKESSQ
ncbi:hypothetical protein HPB47_011125 [Ixodes persulcatus]|uniref:Uncharacterized protein n=1 Tax=Ixodes persulcatus TaxID=34615 RepID=A0AC60NX50_IXOPE|nr:hypothetical protein HPB47_011125 [Ixodes persulcatus]